MTSDQSRSLHVAVVGAGVAGLRAADVLLRSGFQVTILEARGRLGGRVHQEKLPNGRLIDAGANWIHGAKDNPILCLARETGTAVYAAGDVMTVVNEDGEIVPKEDAGNYVTIMWTMFENAFEYARQHSADIDPARSLLDFCRDQILVLVPETDEKWERKRKTVLQMCELWGDYVGSPIERQSLKFFWLEESIEGENLFCAGTYHKILQKIAQPAVEGADIRYRTRVVEVRGKSTTAKGTVQLVTDNGQWLEFDEVVLTTPLGWLKQNLEAFTPPLPERLSRAIQSIEYGCLEKVYISFPRAFWLSPDAAGRAAQGFCLWVSPKYAHNSNPRRWMNEAIELGSMDPPDGHATLLFYIHGDESRYVTSEIRSRPAAKERQAFIFSFFKPYFSRLPSYEEGHPDCEPLACFSTNWLHDDLAGNGSYCNFQVGLQEGDEDIVTMRAGIPAEGIWLAGEHTSPFAALGTVAGAFGSGERVGAQIVESYGKGVP